MDLDGIVLIDKEESMTSFQVVKKVKSFLGLKKAGHTGTLDKAATGLLIVCTNRATSVQAIFLQYPKRYIAKMCMGIETDTLDRYGKVIKRCSIRNYTESEIEEVFNNFLGVIEQVPPVYSAIHHNGLRLYQRVRMGQKVKSTARKVCIRELKLLENRPGFLRFEAEVSSGTYIRSLVRDIASELGTCAYLSYLQRTTIGRYRVDEAVKIKDLKPNCIIPLEKALRDLQEIEIEEKKASLLLKGTPLQRLFPREELEKISEGYSRVMSGGRLLAILEKKQKVRYFKIFSNNGANMDF